MIEKFDQLSFLIKNISDLKSKEEIFDFICKISLVIENYKEEELRQICFNNDLYMDLIWNVFHNESFLSNLRSLLNSPYEDNVTNKLLEEKQIIQLFLRLSFFMISALTPALEDNNIFFIRKSFITSLKHTYNELLDAWNKEDVRYSLLNFLFILEDVNYSAKYRFVKKTPVVLNTNFLNMNQISSRIFVGSMILNSINHWMLPRLFENVIKMDEHPHKLFKTVTRVNHRMSIYEDYEHLLNDAFFNKERKEKLKNFIFLLKDKNIGDLIFLINKVSLNFGINRYEESINSKIKYSTSIKEEVQCELEKLDVFLENEKYSNRWSNKAFLNTIMFFSVLESIKSAKNLGWKISMFDYFLNRWISDLHGIINYHAIENYETVVIYVEGLSDKIILENAYENLYPTHDNFIFYHMGGSKELLKKIDAPIIDDFEKKSVGIFDFDKAYNDFNGLTKRQGNNISGFGEIEGLDHECLLRVRDDGKNKIFAVLLPIPEFRKNIASGELKHESLLSIEMLFEDNILAMNNNLGQKTLPGGSSVSKFIGDKIKFAERTKTFDKSKFDNFKPLFKKLFEILKNDDDV